MTELAFIVCEFRWGQGQLFSSVSSSEDQFVKEKEAEILWILIIGAETSCLAVDPGIYPDTQTKTLGSRCSCGQKIRSGVEGQHYLETVSASF